MSTDVIRSEETGLAPQPPTNMLDAVMRAMLDPSVDPGRLEQFLKIGRELEADQAKRQWAIAFRAAKDEIDGITFTKRGRIVYEGKNGKQASVIKFLEYDDIAEAVKPILRKHELTASYTYRYENTPPKTICVMTLLHAGGHSQVFESVPLPMIDSGGGKSDVQGAGSVMTYGRRYAVQGAFDIVATGQDNDGSGRGAPAQISEEQSIKIDEIVQACSDKDPRFPDRFKRWLKTEYDIEKPSELFQGSQLEAVMDRLKEKMVEMGVR